MTRKYELKRRAERLAETRQQIVEATVGLHVSVGPAQTTISAIAEHAGVQRHTVYAHFGDERELFAACSAHWRSVHPFPDPAHWAEIDDPKRRFGEALDAVYEWYGSVGDDLMIFKRDSGTHAATAELVTRRENALLALRDALVAGWSRRKAVRAAVGHALELETWHSLVRRHGLSRVQAVDAMLRFVSSV